MAKLDLSQAEFLFQCDALSGVTLLVYQFSGRESLSQSFEFQIDLVCGDPDLDLEAPIDQPACLTLQGRRGDGSRYQRYVHGVIERFVQTGAGARQSRYQATLVPTVKRLAFTRNSRIFQNCSGPEVTQKVLKAGRVPSDWVSAMLHGTYSARDYCVQYQESDLDFICRLWEEEGIFYFFEHDNDKDKLVIGDGRHASATLANYDEIEFRDTPELREECILEFRAESTLRPGATVLRDFKFKQPALEMEASAQADKFADFKMYYFPGEYVDPAAGERLAKLRLAELQCQKNRYIGAGNVRALLPGYKFSLRGHRRSDCNQEYLVVAVEHRGAQPQALGEEGEAAAQMAYENRLVCIPAKVSFRPARDTKRPNISGVQTATVVGPPKEEIFCDEHGRVKVQFHWDREGKKDDKSSCWIRVSQPWGGTAFGGIFLPRVGQEVLIQFIEGDPDRPIIIGRVYNGENPLPYPLPAHKTISTLRTASSPGGQGSNELRFEDAAGTEEIFLHGQLDMATVIERDRTQRFGRDTTDTVGRDRTRHVVRNETVRIGAAFNANVGGNETLSVGGNQVKSVGQNQQEQIGKSRTTHIKEHDSLNIGGTQQITVGGDLSLQVKGNQTLKVQAGKQVIEVSGAVHIKSASEIKLSCGAGSITIEQSGNIVIKGPLVKINS